MTSSNKFTPKIWLLRSRYGDSNLLEQISENEYILRLSKESYCRAGYEKLDENGNMLGIDYIDPDGGPFMRVGYELPIKTAPMIEKIEEREVYSDYLDTNSPKSKHFIIITKR